MFTRVGFHFLALIRVAGETGSLYIVHFCKIHRSVTAIAGRNGVFTLWWMFLVTIRTANLCLMQSPSLDDVAHFAQMTFHTVITDQFEGKALCPKKGAQKHYQWTNNNTDKNLFSHPCPHPPV
jgi:hypothetical protein